MSKDKIYLVRLSQGKMLATVHWHQAVKWFLGAVAGPKREPEVVKINPLRISYPKRKLKGHGFGWKRIKPKELWRTAKEKKIEADITTVTEKMEE